MTDESPEKAVPPGAKATEPSIDLSGTWLDGTREFIISGRDVIRGDFVQDYECDPRDGSPIQKTRLCFREGTLTGNQLEGKVVTCVFRESGNVPGGLVWEPFKMTVTSDRQKLEGQWLGIKGWQPISFTRKAVSVADPGFRPCCLLVKSIGSSQAMSVSDITGHQEGFKGTNAAAITGAPSTEGKWGFIYTCAGGFIDLGHIHDQVDLVHYHYQMLHLKHNAMDTYTEPLDNGLVQIKTTIPNSDFLRVAKSIAFYQSVWHEVWSYWNCDLGFHDSSFSPEDLFSNAVGIHAGAKAALATTGTFNSSAGTEIVNVINALGPLSTADTNKAFDTIDGLWVKGSYTREDYLQRRNFSYNPVKPWPLAGFGPCATSTGGIPTDLTVNFDAEMSYYDISFPVPIPTSNIGVNPTFALGSCYSASGPHGFVNPSPISVSQFAGEIANIKKAAKAKYGVSFDSPI